MNCLQWTIKLCWGLEGKLQSWSQTCIVLLTIKVLQTFPGLFKETAKSTGQSSSRIQSSLTPINILILPILRSFSSSYCNNTENSGQITLLFLRRKKTEQDRLESLAPHQKTVQTSCNRHENREWEDTTLWCQVPGTRYQERCLLVQYMPACLWWRWNVIGGCFCVMSFIFSISWEKCIIRFFDCRLFWLYSRLDFLL